MKHCQICNRTYTDESLSYCLDDGAPLSAVLDPEATLVRPKVSSSMRAPIKHASAQSPRASHHRLFYPTIFFLTLLVGAIIGWLIYQVQTRSLSTSPGRSSNTANPTPVNQTSGSETEEASYKSSPQEVRQDQPEGLATRDLNGTWHVLNTVEKTSYQSFANLQIGFRLIIEQKGANFTAEGEKLLENGRTLPTSGRTAIHLTGAIEGDSIRATFVEEGSRRRTNGRFVWRLERQGTVMRGTFESTAANSSGTSVATKNNP